jgi:hypothetical protein
LKDLGVKQKSLFYFRESPRILPQIHMRSLLKKKLSNYEFSAFTVAELGEMLPHHYVSKHGRKNWICQAQGALTPIIYATNEADARAKMLIYFLEQKLVTPLKGVQVMPCVRCGIPIAVNAHAGEGIWCDKCWEIVKP